LLLKQLCQSERSTYEEAYQMLLSSSKIVNYSPIADIGVMSPKTNSKYSQLTYRKPTWNLPCDLLVPQTQIETNYFFLKLQLHATGIKSVILPLTSPHCLVLTIFVTSLIQLTGMEMCGLWMLSSLSLAW